LPAFRRTLTETEAASVMCAYNALGGKPACASPELLEQVLRTDWGFKGFVVSDCGAIDDITTGHKYTKTNVEAVAAAIKAGTDLACTFKDEYLEIPQAVAAGLLTEGEVDRALERVLAGRVRLGLFDPPSIVPFSNIPYSANHAPEHRALALRAAREAIVLLKNDNILPLARQGQKIAVVGPGATSLISLEGNYNGTPTQAVLPLDGMAAAYGAANILYAQGSEFVAGLAVPVPRTAFAGGLQATFFNGTDFQGPPVTTRVDREIDHNWNWVAPAPGVDPKNFSVRWTGTIVPAGAGDHSFEFQRRRCDAKATVERYRIEIEGSPPLEVDGACGSRDAAEAPALKVRFADTAPRRIVIDYAHAAPNYAPAITFAWNAPDEALRAAAVAAARASDLVVAFVGLNAWLEGEEMPVKVEGFEGGDRTDIRLPAAQRELLSALRTAGKPVVLVLQSGSAVALGEEGQAARAVLSAWYGGELGGTAIADVLTGSYNPSGRLPVTFYASDEQLPPFADYSMKGRTYRYFGGKPEYAFGHGLSYTSFAYSRPLVAKSRVEAGGKQEVSVRVRNTGKGAGEEVVQLYLSGPPAAGTPSRSLKGFERVRLRPGEEKQVSFTLTARDLAFADEDGTMRVRSGRYGLWLGGGQPGTGLPGAAASFDVRGTVTLPR
jgi:beta-glucosidase